jgi:predicted dinucleotide-binding enzyme
MNFGIIGAGNVALAFARYALSAGHDVKLSNSGNIDRLRHAVTQLGKGAAAATVREAAQAELVVLAVPWTRVKEVLADLPSWEGRILIDATNPFLQIEPEWVLDDLGDDTASEIVERLAVNARLVKAFNSVLMSNFEKGPVSGGSRRVLLVSGDDTEAKKTVSGLITAFGFAAIDLGNLREGGRLQQAGGALAGHDLLVSQ